MNTFGTFIDFDLSLATESVLPPNSAFEITRDIAIDEAIEFQGQIQFSTMVWNAPGRLMLLLRSLLRALIFRLGSDIALFYGEIGRVVGVSVYMGGSLVVIAGCSRRST